MIKQHCSRCMPHAFHLRFLWLNGNVQGAPHAMRFAALQIEELEHEVVEARMEAKRLVAEARREAAEAQARAESEVRAGTLRIFFGQPVGSKA